MPKQNKQGGENQIFNDWLEKGIVPSRLIWWLYKLQFWKYKEVMKGILIDVKPNHAKTK